MWKRLPAWSWIPLTVFLVAWIHGATLGLTDDEAYYWVLAQRPALGYAFHPPGVAWAIALSQAAFGWLFGPGSSAVVRFPSAAITAAMVALALRWMELARVPERRLGRAALVLLAYAGIFGASWMMVPDLPMLLGWMIVFVETWKLCFAPKMTQSSPNGKGYLLLGLGAAIGLISKFSAVLGIGSAGMCLLLFARPRERNRGIAALVIGTALALVPILLWNARHEWGSILYQFRDRHGHAELSLKRYGRFWASQLLFAGPLLGYVVHLVRRRASFILLWIAPAFAVFCLQPLISDFKPHWALIAWLPAALELARAWGNREDGPWVRAQLAYGLPVIAIGAILCHLPLQAAFTEKVLGRVPDAKLDVTNDMYGWGRLSRALAEHRLDRLPVLGSRYQTASQAAAAIGDASRVSLVPRDIRSRDEWAELPGVVRDEQGGTRLLAPALFVADSRYDAGPGFREARCEKEVTVQGIRWGYLAKEIYVWKCEPSPESRGSPSAARP